MVRQSGCDPLCDPADPAGSCCLSDCGIKKKQKKRDIILEKLFENIDEYSFMNNIFGFTQYR